MKSISFAGRRIPVPGHPVLRIVLGVVFVLGGFLWFLPVVGFWMLPLGLLILSIDSIIVRRLRRKGTVALGRWLQQRWPTLAQRLGLGDEIKGPAND